MFRGYQCMWASLPDLRRITRCSCRPSNPLAPVAAPGANSDTAQQACSPGNAREQSAPKPAPGPGAAGAPAAAAHAVPDQASALQAQAGGVPSASCNQADAAPPSEACSPVQATPLCQAARAATLPSTQRMGRSAPAAAPEAAGSEGCVLDGSHNAPSSTPAGHTQRASAEALNQSQTSAADLRAPNDDRSLPHDGAVADVSEHFVGADGSDSMLCTSIPTNSESLCKQPAANAAAAPAAAQAAHAGACPSTERLLPDLCATSHGQAAAEADLPACAHAGATMAGIADRLQGGADGATANDKADVCFAPRSASNSIRHNGSASPNAAGRDSPPEPQQLLQPAKSLDPQAPVVAPEADDLQELEAWVPDSGGRFVSGNEVADSQRSWESQQRLQQKRQHQQQQRQPMPQGQVSPEQQASPCAQHSSGHRDDVTPPSIVAASRSQAQEHAAQPSETDEPVAHDSAATLGQPPDHIHRAPAACSSAGLSQNAVMSQPHAGQAAFGSFVAASQSVTDSQPACSVHYEHSTAAASPCQNVADVTAAKTAVITRAGLLPPDAPGPGHTCGKDNPCSHSSSSVHCLACWLGPERYSLKVCEGSCHS